VPTGCVVKNALALFVRNDVSKQRVVWPNVKKIVRANAKDVKIVRANAKDVKIENVVKRGGNRDVRSARSGATGVESN
jgi:hypothetical protein